MWTLPIAFAVVLFALITLWARTGGRPPGLGTGEDGRLAPCPASPNCVSSEANDDVHGMVAWSYEGTRDEIHARLLDLVRSAPRASVIEQRDDYIAAEFRTPLFGFIDDVEFLIDDAAKLVHFRSASRLGYSDLGVNRKRMEALRERFGGASVDESTAGEP